MQKALEIAKRIKNDLSADWLSLLDDYNFNSEFGAIYSMQLDIEDKNRIICYIIYAYDPDSLWLDFNKDRLANKMKILESLAADTRLPIYQEVVYGSNDRVGMCIFNFLENLKTWEWRTVFELLDMASKIQRFATDETEDERSYQKMNKEGELKTITSEIDITTLVKAYQGKSDLLDQAIEKRKKADVILADIKKNFLSTDIATQSDFGFTFTDTAKKRDILSWSFFIRGRNEKKKNAALAD
jgi:hypothetical protein